MSKTDKLFNFVVWLVNAASVIGFLAGLYMTASWIGSSYSVHWPPYGRWGVLLLWMCGLHIYQLKSRSKENVEEIRLKRIIKEAMQEDWSFGDRYYGRKWAVKDAIREVFQEEERKRRR
jgi:hypothetical protein